MTLREYAFAVFGDIPVADVDTALVMRVVEPLWATTTETASRLRGRIERILDWATISGFRPEGPNPARWKGHLEHLLPRKSKIAPVAHHAALPYRRIGDFFAELRQQSGIAARALEFLVLTWARTGEVIGAWWEEIEGDVWRVPPERMKSEREHVVPLCGRAVEIITEMRAILARRPSDYVFQGLKDGQPLSNMSLLMLLRRMGHAELTTHGFRATARTWAAAETAFPREMLEIALAHTMDDKTEEAYQRSDMFAKRRKLAEAGARYCDKPAQNGNGKVIAIGGA